MKISKFLNDPNDKPFHTSGYAEIAHGGAIGSTSSQSYQQRTRIDRNRQSIQKYRDSLIAQTHAHRNTHPQIDLTTSTAHAPLSRQQLNATPSTPGVAPIAPKKVARPTFKDSNSRGFNPYA